MFVVQERKNLKTQQVLHTISVKGAMKHARVIQEHFYAHRNVVRAKREAFESLAASFPAALRGTMQASDGAASVLKAATACEAKVRLQRRQVASALGVMPSAAEGSVRAMPLTHAVVAQAEQRLRDDLLSAVKGAQDRLAPAAPASVANWAAALERRGKLEGGLETLRKLEEAWPMAPMLVGQVSLVAQQLRAPPPPPPRNVPASDAAVEAAVGALLAFARFSGSAAVVDSFQAQRYGELLYKLALQRQEALRVALRLEFCHQLRGMRKRHALVNVTRRHADTLAGYVPIRIHRACVLLTLRCDD